MTKAVLTLSQRDVTHGWHRYSLNHPNGYVESFTARGVNAAYSIALAFLGDVGTPDVPVVYQPFPVFVNAEVAA
jgi:hypothetical protein